MTQLLNMDIRTVMFLLALGNLSAAALLLVYIGRLRDAPDTMFALAKLMQGLAWPLLALRGEIPDPLSFGAGNALLLSGFWLEAACIGVLDRPGPLWPRAWKTVLATLAACLATGTIIEQPNLRVALISAAATFCFALTGLRLFRVFPSPSRLRALQAGMYLLLAALVVWRGLAALATSTVTMFTPGLPLTVVYLPLYLLLFAGSFGMLLVFKERDDQLLAQMASHDELTGAPNRRSVLDMAGRLIAKAHRENSALAVLMLDIDHFKQVNDTHGHMIGDMVLRDLTRIISEGVRAYDAYGRYGGEEFVAVLPGASLDDARHVAERIRAAAEASRPIGSEAVLYTVSIGISWGIPEKESLEALLHQADMAMYAAKRLGRNRVAASPTDGDAG